MIRNSAGLGPGERQKRSFNVRFTFTPAYSTTLGRCASGRLAPSDPRSMWRSAVWPPWLANVLGFHTGCRSLSRVAQTGGLYRPFRGGIPVVERSTTFPRETYTDTPPFAASRRDARPHPELNQCHVTTPRRRTDEVRSSRASRLEDSQSDASRVRIACNFTSSCT